jgi:hypothetical protein
MEGYKKKMKMKIEASIDEDYCNKYNNAKKELP